MKVYRDSMVCQACHMTLTPASAFHPHLHCIIWKAYQRDPEWILEQSGYVRAPAVDRT